MYIITAIAITTVLITSVALNYLHAAIGIVILALMWSFVWLINLPPGPVSNSFTTASPAALSVTETCTRFRFDVAQKARNRPVMLFGGILVICGCSFVLLYSLWGLCLDMYTGNVSTRLSRQYATVGCAEGPPCHVFVTVADVAPSTALIVNFHTKTAGTPSTVYYDTVSRGGTVSSYAFNATGQGFYMDGIDEPRYVHWVDLTNLTPNTTYYFVVGAVGNTGPERAVRTAPAGDTFMFVAGGDMDINAQAVQTSQAAAAIDPAFALIGGDLAYANGWSPCYLKWDAWLRQWEDNMRTPDGRLIPLLTAIGNHETSTFFGADPLTQVAFYTRYLPHQLGLYTTSPLLRPTYRAHPVGNNTLILALDSNHVAPPSGAQAAWIAQQLNTSNIANKLAVYHVPMYPSARAANNVDSTLLRQFWEPLFSQYKLKLGLENHDHAYKRTYPLSNGMVVNEAPGNGTVYVGDGCWGRTPRASAQTWYQANVQSKRHFLRVDVVANNVTVTAIETGVGQFDSVSLL